MIMQEQYGTLRDEIREIRIELDRDPATSGIGVLNEKIADVHALKDRVSSILGDAIANVFERDRFYQELKSDYDVKFDSILHTKENIRNLKSEGLRRASCNAELPDEFAKMTSAKIDLTEAEGFQKFVQSKYNLLDSANTNISRQISVIELQLQIGEIARGSGVNGFEGRNIGVKK